MGGRVNKLILDIETIPNQLLKDDLKPQFDKTTVKLGNTKDAEKVKAKIDSAKEEFNNGLTKKMSIESNYCQILSLAYIELDFLDNEISRDVLFDDKDDKSILEKFNKIYTGQKIIGWNSKNFDIPVIRKRAILQKIKNPFPNFGQIVYPYGDTSIDLMHGWNGSNKYGKMSTCASLLGIESKTGMDGIMIYQAWKDKRYDEIKAYNIQDVECTLAIYRRIYG